MQLVIQANKKIKTILQSKRGGTDQKEKLFADIVTWMVMGEANVKGIYEALN
jgi:hypothetical protein